MSRYHLNPKTGEPGQCQAAIACPFGDINADHYDSPEEARRAYEQSQAVPKWTRTAYGHSLGPYALMPNTRVGGWTVFEVQEVEGKLVPFTPLATHRTLTEAKQEAECLAMPEAKPKNAPKERAKNWALVRYSSITGMAYIDRVFTQQRQAQKKWEEMNRYEHHSSSYEVMRTEDAKKLPNLARPR